MSDTPTSMLFIETPAGKAQLKSAMIKLKNRHVPETGDEYTMSISDFHAMITGISVPRSASANLTSSDMVTASANFKEALASFEAALADAEPPAEPSPPHIHTAGTAGRSSGATASISVDGTASGTASFKLGSDTASGGTAADASALKRRRLGMSDSDLARACTVVDMPPAKATPRFLVDKPLDVRLYTPLLVELYASIRKELEGLSLVAREVYKFEGDFLELSPEEVTALPTTPLFATCDIEMGSCLLHRLETIQAAAVALRAKNLRFQRAFWLANHTPGCNWDTWEQLCHREEQDEGADLCNPSAHHMGGASESGLRSPHGRSK
jgi:hypothetical protein